MYKLKQTTLLLVVIVMIAIMAMSPEKSSSGAPPSHTGAPGEATCATIGCHDDNTTNNGTAKLTINMGGATHYVPGQTYPVSVQITDPSITRFGFQVVALAANKQNAGSFSLADGLRTQFAKNTKEFADRQYVTYTFNGTDAVSAGKGEWLMNWTAPSSNIGAVTFYASAVSANDDESDKGDHVYTTSNTLIAQ
jgi:hypothetical protein